MAVIAFRRRYDRAVILRYHRVIEADGRHIRRSGNIDDQLAGAVGPERVGDADVEHFLWELGIGEALACIQLLQQLGLGDLVGVALHPLAGIFGQVEALPALQGQIVVIARIHLLGDEQLLGGQGLGTDLPAVGLEVGHPVLVALDPLWAGDGRGGRLPGGAAAQGQHQGGAAGQGGHGHPDGQLSVAGQFCSQDYHSAFSFQRLGFYSCL